MNESNQKKLTNKQVIYTNRWTNQIKCYSSYLTAGDLENPEADSLLRLLCNCCSNAVFLFSNWVKIRYFVRLSIKFSSSLACFLFKRVWCRLLVWMLFSIGAPLRLGQITLGGCSDSFFFDLFELQITMLLNTLKKFDIFRAMFCCLIHRCIIINFVIVWTTHSSGCALNVNSYFSH